MNYEELICTLRNKDFDRDNEIICTPFECGAFSICDRAATAIETLLKDNSALKEALGRFCDETGDGCDLCKHFPCTTKHGRCIGWEWRGVEDK